MRTPRVFPQQLSRRPGVGILTPYDEAFIAQLKAMVPRGDIWFNPYSKHWWVAIVHQDVVRHLVSEHFGTYELEDDDGVVVIHTAGGEQLHQESLL